MILFLDFDGVLHPWGSRKPFANAPLLAEVVKDYPALDIVISSSWRTNMTLPQLKALLPADIASHVVGKTPDLQGYIGQTDRDSDDWLKTRQDECEEWLKLNDRLGEDWIALDDEGINFRSKDRLVKPDTRKGIGPEDMALLRKKLDGSAKAANRS